MKIKPEHLATLRERIAQVDGTTMRGKYLAGNFWNADQVQDLDKRYRWDVLRATGLTIGDGAGMRGDLDLYAYMDDTHIDTALRSLIPPLDPESRTPIPDTILRGRKPLHRDKHYVIVASDNPDNDTLLFPQYRVIDVRTGNESNLHTKSKCLDLIKLGLADDLKGSVN